MNDAQLKIRIGDMLAKTGIDLNELNIYLELILPQHDVTKRLDELIIECVRHFETLPDEKQEKIIVKIQGICAAKIHKMMTDEESHDPSGKQARHKIDFGIGLSKILTNKA